MKKHRIFITILLVITLLSLTMPVNAAAGREKVGERIYIYYELEDPLPFSASQPFYIASGWANPSDIPGVGLFKFSLDIDGVPVNEDFIERSAISGDPDYLLWLWVYTFPEGMTGSHSFTGHWSGPCQGLVDMEVIPGPCEVTNEIIESRLITIVVDFGS